MLICTPCGAQAPDDAVSCGACGESSWAMAATPLVTEPPTPLDEDPPPTSEPAEEAPTATSLFVDAAPAQRPQNQNGKGRGR